MYQCLLFACLGLEDVRSSVEGCGDHDWLRLLLWVWFLAISFTAHSVTIPAGSYRLRDIHVPQSILPVQQQQQCPMCPVPPVHGLGYPRCPFHRLPKKQQLEWHVGIDTFSVIMNSVPTSCKASQRSTVVYSGMLAAATEDGCGSCMILLHRPFCCYAAALCIPGILQAVQGIYSKCLLTRKITLRVRA